MNRQCSHEEVEKNLDIININIDRLLSLANELLDFAKIENNGFLLRPYRTDITRLTNEVISSFSYLFIKNSLNIETSLPDPDTYANIDPEIYVKIITNLLANATKYSASSIKVTLKWKEPVIKLVISNDGKRILKENIDNLFTDYFRENISQTGTGLGLPLVKRLAVLHEGDITFDSQDTTMNTFIVTIKAQTIEAPEQEERQDGQFSAKDDKKCIVVLDDDKGIREYLHQILSRQYNVYCCATDAELYSILQNNMIDLIICDIMMPDISGLDLCRQLRSHIEYSHIPIILLSAKSDEETRIEGMMSGADSFVEKPFSINYLYRQIENQFKRIERIRESLKDNITNEDISEFEQIDNTFLNKLSEFLLEHLDNENISIDDISAEMNISRSSLYRKIKGLTQMSPNEYIRLFKLKKAAEFLSTGKYRIGEVSYLVGFSSNSYFSKCFQRQFGLSPTEYMNK